MNRTGRHLLVLLAVLVATAAAGLVLDRTVHAPSRASPPATSASSPSPDPVAPATRASGPAVLPPTPVGSALEAVARLTTADGATGAPYVRAAFGQSWLDTDRNGCDTRNDVLRRDLADPRLKPGTRGCVVLSGTLLDPYTGIARDFERGGDTSPLVQVDHVVALADAWRSGADAWATERREGFANDPLELLAVDGRVNSAKSDGAAATWLPPDPGAHCAYAARQVAVKLTWGLSATPAEAAALREVLGACPDEPLPARAPFVLGPAD